MSSTGSNHPSQASPRCHLAYLTANDSPHYQADFLNFRHMTRHDPGVERVELYIAVSRVRPFTATDQAAIHGLLQMASECPWLRPHVVLWKGNTGRDFSSAEACLNAIGDDGAGPQDYVMVRNRSAYGPTQRDWYAQYVAQYERFEDTGLVGSTINFRGHPLLPTDGPTTHVQTYAYLSQWNHFAPLATAYPASRCTDRLELINAGEIGLSRRMLERGLSISCLHWPNERFTLQRQHAEHLPQTDIKSRAVSLSLRYKYAAYLRQIPNLWAQLMWWRKVRALHLANTPPPHVRQVTLDQYG